MRERNLGIDLLRIVSMMMIVLIHILGHGGVLENSKLFSVSYNIGWLLELAAMCSVNCYALVSGYVGIDATFKYSNIIYLWFQTMFYSVIIMVVFVIFKPEAVGLKDAVMAFFPVLYRQYWYFCAYFAMFFFIPFLNHLLNTLQQEQLKVLIFTIVVLFTILPTLRQADIFNSADGYSPLWLAFLYLIGGFIKKVHIQKKRQMHKLLYIYLGCVLITWASKLCIEYITMRLLGKPWQDPFLTLYTSPTMLLAACVMLIFFSDLKIKKYGCLHRYIEFFCPMTFGVYLIHENNFIRKWIIQGTFSYIVDFPTVIFVSIIIVSVLIIYISSSFIDWIRCYLFKVFKIKEFSQFLVWKSNEICKMILKA